MVGIRPCFTRVLVAFLFKESRYVCHTEVHQNSYQGTLIFPNPKEPVSRHLDKAESLDWLHAKNDDAGKSQFLFPRRGRVVGAGILSEGHFQDIPKAP